MGLLDCVEEPRKMLLRRRLLLRRLGLLREDNRERGIVGSSAMRWKPRDLRSILPALVFADARQHTLCTTGLSSAAVYSTELIQSSLQGYLLLFFHPQRQQRLVNQVHPLHAQRPFVARVVKPLLLLPLMALHKL